MADVLLDSGKPLATGAEIIETFHLPVRLDEHIRRSSVANRLTMAVPSHDHSRHIFQIVDLKIHRAFKPPMVEDRDEEIRTRSYAITLPNRPNRVMSKVGHQISDLFASEPKEMTVHAQRVSSQGNHTSNTIRHFRFLQEH